MYSVLRMPIVEANTNGLQKVAWQVASDSSETHQGSRRGGEHRCYCSVTLRPRQDIDCSLPGNFRDQISPTFRERTMANLDERTVQIVGADVVPRYLESDAVKVALNWRQRYVDVEAAIWDHSKHERLRAQCAGEEDGVQYCRLFAGAGVKQSSMNLLAVCWAYVNAASRVRNLDGSVTLSTGLAKPSGGTITHEAAYRRRPSFQSDSLGLIKTSIVYPRYDVEICFSMIAPFHAGSGM